MYSSSTLTLQINNINNHLFVFVHSAQCSVFRSKQRYRSFAQSRNHCSLGVTETRTPRSLRAASQPNTGATSTTRPLWSHCLTVPMVPMVRSGIVFKASSLESNLLSWYLYHSDLLRRSTGKSAVRKSGFRLTRSQFGCGCMMWVRYLSE